MGQWEQCALSVSLFAFPANGQRECPVLTCVGFEVSSYWSPPRKHTCLLHHQRFFSPTFVFRLCARVRAFYFVTFLWWVMSVMASCPSQKASAMRKGELTPCGTGVSLSQVFYWLVRWPNSSRVMKLGGGYLQHACLFSWISTPLAFG